MKKPVKVALFVALGSFALLVATCGGFAAWLYSSSDRLAAEGKAAMREGAHFGGGKGAEECVGEALRRLSTQDLGIVGEATNKVFLEACLDVAQAPPGFCHGVPPRDEILKTATWLLARCEGAGRPNDQPCTRLLGAIQEYCLEPR